MLITWSFPQLLLILFVGFGFLAVTFSRHNPMSEAFVLILAAHFVVINSLCWNAYLMMTTFKVGEEIFRFPFSPFLLAASFYLGIMAVFTVIAAWISVFRSARKYSRRQKWAFSVSCLTWLIGLVVSIQTPITLQRCLDSIPVTH